MCADNYIYDFNRFIHLEYLNFDGNLNNNIHLFKNSFSNLINLSFGEYFIQNINALQNSLPNLKNLDTISGQISL